MAVTPVVVGNALRRCKCHSCAVRRRQVHAASTRPLLPKPIAPITAGKRCRSAAIWFTSGPRRVQTDGTLKIDLIPKKSDVDARCLELYRKAIPGWHAFLDRGGKLDNISRLEKGLAQLSQVPQP